jgi:hypothetical protein
VDDLCWACAHREGSAPTRYRPLSRQQYRGLFLWPGSLFAAGLLVLGVHVLGDASASRSALIAPVISLALVLLAAFVFLRNQLRVPGSTVEASKVRPEHARLADRFVDGDADVADELEALLVKAYPLPGEHAALLVTLATVEWTAGRVDRAALLLEAARSTGWLERPVDRVRVSAALAHCAASAGRLDSAQAHLDDASAASTPHTRGHLATAEAHLLVRRGEVATALGRFDSWEEAARTAGVERAARPVLAVLRAFCLSVDGQPASAIEEALSPLRGTGWDDPDAHRGLGHGWAELRRFLDSHLGKPGTRARSNGRRPRRRGARRRHPDRSAPTAPSSTGR